MQTPSRPIILPLELRRKGERAMAEVFVDPDVLDWLSGCTANTSADMNGALGRCQSAVSNVQMSGWDTGRWSDARNSLSGQIGDLDGLNRELQSRACLVRQLAPASSGPAASIGVGSAVDAALASEALQMFGYAKDVWGRVDAIPGAKQVRSFGGGMLFTGVETVADAAADPNFHKAPLLAFGKAGLKDFGGLIVGDAVTETIIGASVAGTGPVIVVAVAAGWVASDEVGHVVDEVIKEDWAGDMQKKGVISGLADDMFDVGVKGTVDTGVDIWNGVGGALNLTAAAGQFAGQQLRAGVVGIGQIAVGALTPSQ